MPQHTYAPQGFTGYHLLLLAGLYLLLLALTALLTPRLQPAEAHAVSLPFTPPAPLDAANNSQVGDYYLLHHTVQPGQSLLSIFRDLKLETDPLLGLLTDEKARTWLQDLQPGDQIQLALDRQGNFNELRLTRNTLHELRIRQTDNKYHVDELTYNIQAFDAFGEMLRTERPVYADALAAGVPEQVLGNIADLLEWTAPPALEGTSGDLFLFLYKALYVNGQRVDYGPITALEYRPLHNRATRRIFRYQAGSKQPHQYYFSDGSSIQKKFLRSPLRGLFQFNLLAIPTAEQPLGMDYTAPVGTEIHATGAGQVHFVGNRKGDGNLLIMQHPGGYQTHYGHLNQHAPGLRAGSRVTRGQVIGYVGRSGLSAAHSPAGGYLHYEFRTDNALTLPEQAHLPTGTPLAASERNLFDTLVLTRTTQLHLFSRLLPQKL